MVTNLALLNERVDDFFKTTRLPFFLAILPLLIVNAVVINNGSPDHLGRIFNDPILEVKNFNAFFKHKIKLFKSCSLNLKLPLSFKSGTATWVPYLGKSALCKCGHFTTWFAHLKSPSGFWCGLPIISILTKGNSLFLFSLSWKVHFGLLCPFLLRSKKKT